MYRSCDQELQNHEFNLQNHEFHVHHLFSQRTKGRSWTTRNHKKQEQGKRIASITMTPTMIPPLGCQFFQKTMSPIMSLRSNATLIETRWRHHSHLHILNAILVAVIRWIFWTHTKPKANILILISYRQQRSLSCCRILRSHSDFVSVVRLYSR